MIAQEPSWSNIVSTYYLHKNKSINLKDWLKINLKRIEN
jgi:hypothetical protein